MLFETSEFSVFIKKLPQLNHSYTIEMLKADLWTHVTTIIQDEKQQIDQLVKNPCEIVDI